MVFTHIGLIANEPKPGEVFIEATRVWATDFTKHPFHIEWLRFESDSPVTGPVRTQAHVGYRVDSIAQASQGLKVLIEPFESRDNRRVGFYETSDGAVIELMEYGAGSAR